MAAASISLVLIEEEDQFISIASFAMGYGPQDWGFLYRHQ